MSARTNKRRIYQLLHNLFHGKSLYRRSSEEQAWLDLVPVGREFGSPDYERLQILDLYAAGQISSDDAMLKLRIDSLVTLHQQMLATGLIFPGPDASVPLNGMFAGKVSRPISIETMNKATSIAAVSSERKSKK